MNFHLSLRLSLLCFALLFPLSGKSDPIPKILNPLQVEGRLGQQKTAPGALLDLHLDLELPEHYMAYLDKFELIPVEPENLKFGTIKASPLVEFTDVVTRELKKGVEGNSNIKTLVEFPATMPLGNQQLVFDLKYQACTKKFCLFPAKKRISLPIEVVGADEIHAPAQIAPSIDSPTNIAQSEFEKALNKGFLSAFFLVFVFGFLSSLTPCVYPMIPITMAIIGAGSSGQSTARSFGLSLVYVFGISITYSVLGILAASTGALFGAFLGNIWVSAFIALFFVAMALSMFGVFEIKLPSFLHTRLMDVKGEGQLIKTFIAGLVAGLVVSPCVGPILFGVLAYISQTGNLALGAAFLFAFAWGLGVLFLVLGTFSHLVNRLPKSGPWLNIVKNVFGCILLGASVYYLKPVLPPIYLSIYIGLVLIGVASYLGAFSRASNKNFTLQKIKRGALLALFCIGVAYMLKGLNLLPGQNKELSQQISEKIRWENYSPLVIQEALENNSPVIIDFYADWCAACVHLEKRTFSDKSVVQKSKEFIMIKVDVTHKSSEWDQVMEMYQVMSLPTLIFINPQGKVRADLTLREFEKSDKFIQRMLKAQTK